MFFRQISDDYLAQYAYLIGCRRTKEAILIDPERDIDRYVRLAEAEGFSITAVAETHIHADFLSGAREFAEQYSTRLYLSDEGDADAKYEWIRNVRYDVRLLKDRDVFRVGNIRIQTVHTPGHTPEHLSFLVTDAGGGADKPMGLITGDFVFVGDVGRPDLLETAVGQKGVMRPAAKRLHGSVLKFLVLDDYLHVWPGHGAGSACGKALGSVPTTTVGYERRFSPALEAARFGENRFVEYVLTDQPEPPAYFGRMKALNRQGPPILGELPRPARLSAERLTDLATRGGTVIDTRADRAAFFGGHIPGALYAPLDKAFPTVAGSYVDPEAPLYLIVEEDQVDEAVRNLVRVGLDRIEGYTTPAEMEAAPERLRSTERIDFAEAERRRHEADTLVVDVRRADEYEEGHIPGALHLPHTRLPVRLDELPEGKTLLVHCATGIRSSAATALLEREGFTAVLVDDTFANWAEAYGSVEMEDAHS